MSLVLLLILISINVFSQDLDTIYYDKDWNITDNSG
jgi:hypothetical protein